MVVLIHDEPTVVSICSSTHAIEPIGICSMLFGRHMFSRRVTFMVWLVELTHDTCFVLSPASQRQSAEIAFYHLIIMPISPRHMPWDISQRVPPLFSHCGPLQYLHKTSGTISHMIVVKWRNSPSHPLQF